MVSGFLITTLTYIDVGALYRDSRRLHGTYGSWCMNLPSYATVFFAYGTEKLSYVNHTTGVNMQVTIRQMMDIAFGIQRVYIEYRYKVNHGGSINDLLVAGICSPDSYLQFIVDHHLRDTLYWGDGAIAKRIVGRLYNYSKRDTIAQSITRLLSVNDLPTYIWMHMLLTVHATFHVSDITVPYIPTTCAIALRICIRGTYIWVYCTPPEGLSIVHIQEWVAAGCNPRPASIPPRLTSRSASGVCSICKMAMLL